MKCHYDSIVPVPVGWMRLFASSKILFTASIDSKRTYCTKMPHCQDNIKEYWLM